jgi:hypothetical protein
MLSKIVVSVKYCAPFMIIIMSEAESTVRCEVLPACAFYASHRKMANHRAPVFQFEKAGIFNRYTVPKGPFGKIVSLKGRCK